MRIDRGKRKDNGEWVYGFYVAFAAYKGEEIKHYIQTLNDNNTLGLIHEVIPETVGQILGINDNTLWKSLSEDEKNRFYLENCSEDGITVKYQRVEQVIHLWKGKKIFEGDIIKTLYDDQTIGVIKNGAFKEQDYDNEVIDLHANCYGFYVECMTKGKTWTSSILNNGGAWFKVIGNIHDNPELLEVSHA